MSATGESQMLCASCTAVNWPELARSCKRSGGRLVLLCSTLFHKLTKEKGAFHGIINQPLDSGYLNQVKIEGQGGEPLVFEVITDNPLAT